MKITLESSMAGFLKKFEKSKELTEKCKSKIPGGFSRKTFNYGPHGIFVDRGEGQYIFTVEGHKLLDMNNNFTVNILGHNDPNISKAIMDTIPKGFSFGSPTEYESKLAEILIDRIESIEKVKFSCSASESCISAVRIARGYTGKTKIAKFEGGYHGFVDNLAISAHPSPDRFPGPDYNPTPLPDSDGIPSFVTESTIILKQNDLAVCEKILRENAHDIACVIMELQSGAGGIVVLDQDFVEGIRALTEELDIVLIFDETITLRAGYHGLQGVYGVNPDLTILGKMIGGGIPIGAVGGASKFFEVLEADQVMISGTHHGHPLAAVAGIASMEAMNEAALAKLNNQAARIKKEINEWANSKNYPFMIYGKGFSFLAYTFTDKIGREIRTHRDFWRYADNNKTNIYSLEIATRGFLPVYRGQFSLSLPMTDEDITAFIETTKDIVTGIME
ncbi:aspartate aminotransferase family protein [Priestia aryabhattai]|uniref:aspartate aminotransferase family protein n=1 Tax=Priestia aryabhattai TaxID=412384 RepID=UPI001CCC9563|nr:aminotransferase class III-fold pyridoxal phosphate-dependent enzyme [Priestia aryabhattai]MBZ6489482.1 aminotransferase class III-fold pyridoxal phosphate-dependent enzyme [Priestia aryabhattai]